jgi:hypothetical protein
VVKCWLSDQKPVFKLRRFYAKFMVDEVAMKQIFLWDSSVLLLHTPFSHLLLSCEIAMIRHHTITFPLFKMWASSPTWNLLCYTLRKLSLFLSNLLIQYWIVLLFLPFRCSGCHHVVTWGSVKIFASVFVSDGYDLSVHDTIFKDFLSHNTPSYIKLSIITPISNVRIAAMSKTWK